MDRKRITQNIEDIKFCNPCYLCKHPEEMPKRNKRKCSIEECDWLKCWDEFVKLEDEIEQGFWLKLPVPLNTIVWAIDSSYDDFGDPVDFVRPVPFAPEHYSDWGKWVFATEDEAKAELEKQKQRGLIL